MPDSLVNKPIKTEAKPVASKLKGSEVLANSQNNTKSSFFSFCDYLDKSASDISDKVASGVESTAKEGMDGVVAATKEVGASVGAIDKKVAATASQVAKVAARDLESAKKDIGNVARTVYGNLQKDVESTAKDIGKGAKILSKDVEKTAKTVYAGAKIAAIDVEKSAHVAQNVFIGAGKEIVDHPGKIVLDAAVGIAVGAVATAGGPIVGVGLLSLGVGYLYLDRKKLWNDTKLLGTAAKIDFNRHDYSAKQLKEARSVLQDFGGGVAQFTASLAGGIEGSSIIKDAGLEDSMFSGSLFKLDNLSKIQTTVLDRFNKFVGDTQTRYSFVNPESPTLDGCKYDSRFLANISDDKVEVTASSKPEMANFINGPVVSSADKDVVTVKVEPTIKSVEPSQDNITSPVGEDESSDNGLKARLNKVLQVYKDINKKLDPIAKRLKDNLKHLKFIKLLSFEHHVTSISVGTIAGTTDSTVVLNQTPLH